MKITKVKTKKTTQTIDVDKKTLEGVKDGTITYLIEPDALNYSIKKKGTVRYKSSKKRVKFTWVMWKKLDELNSMEIRGAGFKNIDEVENFLKDLKPNFQSNSNVTVLKLQE